jgi:hypothetical protein
MLNLIFKDFAEAFEWLKSKVVKIGSDRPVGPVEPDLHPVRLVLQKRSARESDKNC